VIVVTYIPAVQAHAKVTITGGSIRIVGGHIRIQLNVTDRMLALLFAARSII
jgi:hypothetical protein